MKERHFYVTTNGFIELLFLVGFYAKQFYILPSGSLQIGDMLILAGVILSLYPGFEFEKSDRWLILFVACVFAINMFYGIARHNSTYTNHSIFYLFNLLFVIGIRGHLDSKNFLRNITIVLKAGILTQFMVYILHLGRKYDALRYMGTFNDPNQLAFFCFISFLLIAAISEILGNKKRLWLWGLMAFVMVVLSSSTGMLLGYMVCVFCWFIGYLKTADVKMKAALICVVTAAFAAAVLLIVGVIPLPEFTGELFVVQRALSKFTKFTGGAIKKRFGFLPC